MEPTRGEIFPSGQRRGLAAPGEDNSRPGSETLAYLYNCNIARTKTEICRARHRHARCGNPNPTGWLLIGGGLWRKRAARFSSRDNVEASPHPGRIGSHPRIKILPYLHNSNNKGTKTEIPRLDTAPRCVETPSILLLIGVREANGQHPMGARSSASSSTAIKYCTATFC